MSTNQYIQGSIQVILNLKKSTGATLQDVLDAWDTYVSYLPFDQTKIENSLKTGGSRGVFCVQYFQEPTPEICSETVICATSQAVPHYWVNGMMSDNNPNNDAFSPTVCEMYR